MRGKEIKENITQYFEPKVSYDCFYLAMVSKMIAIVDRKVKFNSGGANKLDRCELDTILTGTSLPFLNLENLVEWFKFNLQLI